SDLGRRLGAYPAQVRHRCAADRGSLGGQGAGGMSSLFAFPGQGAQKPGMLHRLPDEPQIAAALAEASEVLGEDALALASAEALPSTRPMPPRSPPGRWIMPMPCAWWRCAAS